VTIKGRLLTGPGVGGAGAVLLNINTGRCSENRMHFGWKFRPAKTGDWKVARTGRLESLPYMERAPLSDGCGRRPRIWMT
jgi:hypothetical protein